MFGNPTAAQKSKYEDAADKLEHFLPVLWEIVGLLRDVPELQKESQRAKLTEGKAKPPPPAVAAQLAAAKAEPAPCEQARAEARDAGASPDSVAAPPMKAPPPGITGKGNPQGPPPMKAKPVDVAHQAGDGLASAPAPTFSLDPSPGQPNTAAKAPAGYKPPPPAAKMKPPPPMPAAALSPQPEQSPEATAPGPLNLQEGSLHQTGHQFPDSCSAAQSKASAGAPPLKGPPSFKQPPPGIGPEAKPPPAKASPGADQLYAKGPPAAPQQGTGAPPPKKKPPPTMPPAGLQNPYVPVKAPPVAGTMGYLARDEEGDPPFKEPPPQRPLWKEPQARGPDLARPQMKPPPPGVAP
mmetsp:Transcript_54018/g.128689  ORF Transcript_54018/g.128689 Transcript_54018/m.128689 type:complete len:352 (-) Transcript_54018:194-1249(-)